MEDQSNFNIKKYANTKESDEANEKKFKEHMAANMQVSLRGKAEDEFMQDTMHAERINQQTLLKDINGGLHTDQK